MEDKLGSYLLQELAIWVCGQVGDRDFPHDLWIMAPVYESGVLCLGGHHSSTVLLVRRNDLCSFRDWERCRAMHVERRSHGERILTLFKMVAEFDRQDTLVQKCRSEARRSNYEETMYILDLGACPGISIQVTSMDDQSVQVASIRPQCLFAPIPAA